MHSYTGSFGLLPLAAFLGLLCGSSQDDMLHSFARLYSSAPSFEPLTLCRHVWDFYPKEKEELVRTVEAHAEPGMQDAGHPSPSFKASAVQLSILKLSRMEAWSL